MDQKAQKKCRAPVTEAGARNRKREADVRHLLLHLSVPRHVGPLLTGSRRSAQRVAFCLTGSVALPCLTITPFQIWSPSMKQ
jgi:hypothetical protein